MPDAAPAKRESPAAPPRGVRQIVIFDHETPTDSSSQSVRLDRKGKLVISGRDTGEMPKRFWGK